MTSQTSTSHDVVERLQWRYATKKFDSAKKISSETWGALEESLILTPSSFGLQPWRFVVITDQKVKEQLVPVSWNQNQPADCSHLVVIARLLDMTEQHIDRYLNRIVELRKSTPEKLQPLRNTLIGFVGKLTPEEVHDWMALQCYIALGNLMTTAAILNVDSCPMEGFDPQEYDRILNLHEHGCTSVVVCALGYRAPDDKYQSFAKVRFPTDEVIIRV